MMATMYRHELAKPGYVREVVDTTEGWRNLGSNDHTVYSLNCPPSFRMSLISVHHLNRVCTLFWVESDGEVSALPSSCRTYRENARKAESGIFPNKQWLRHCHKSISHCQISTNFINRSNGIKYKFRSSIFV